MLPAGQHRQVTKNKPCLHHHHHVPPPGSHRVRFRMCGRVWRWHAELGAKGGPVRIIQLAEHSFVGHQQGGSLLLPEFRLNLRSLLARRGAGRAGGSKSVHLTLTHPNCHPLEHPLPGLRQPASARVRRHTHHLRGRRHHPQRRGHATTVRPTQQTVSPARTRHLLGSGPRSAHQLRPALPQLRRIDQDRVPAQPPGPRGTAAAI